MSGRSEPLLRADDGIDSALAVSSDEERTGGGGEPVRRVAEVIELDPTSIDAYERLHAACWPGVLDRLRRSRIANYSIYRYGTLLFSYFEYLGEDYATDLADIAADPVTQEWWRLCSPMQRPVPARGPAEWWHALPEIFHVD